MYLNGWIHTSHWTTFLKTKQQIFLLSSLPLAGAECYKIMNYGLFMEEKQEHCRRCHGGQLQRMNSSVITAIGQINLGFRDSLVISL